MKLDGELSSGGGTERRGGGGEAESYHSDATGNPGPILQHVYLQSAFVRLCDSEDHPRTCLVDN